MRQSEQDIIDAAIEHLEHFRSRIGMYIGRRDVRQTVAFLTGFGVGLAATGIEFVDKAQWKVWVDRGWRLANVGPIPKMEAKGMDEEAIVHELVEIEIEVLRRYRVHAG